MIIESSHQLDYHKAIGRVCYSGISREIIPYNCSVNTYRSFQYKNFQHNLLANNVFYLYIDWISLQ